MPSDPAPIHPASAKALRLALGFAVILTSPLAAFSRIAYTDGNHWAGHVLASGFAVGWIVAILALWEAKCLARLTRAQSYVAATIGFVAVSLTWNCLCAVTLDPHPNSLTARVGEGGALLAAGAMVLMGAEILLAKRASSGLRVAPLLASSSLLTALMASGTAWITGTAIVAAWAWTYLGLTLVLDAKRMRTPLYGQPL